jgi:hypothetical protein
MARATIQTLGQELHLNESVLTTRLAVKSETRAALTRALVEALPQSSTKTRLRLAEKLIQRLVQVEHGKIVLTPVVRFIASTRDAQAQRDLVFYCMAKTDAIVEVLASEVLYPVLIESRPPKGLTAADFRAMNTATLFEMDRIVTRRFVGEYAGLTWGFRSQQSITRALRAMRQAGLLDHVRVSERPALSGFALAPHSLSLAAFMLALHEELQPRFRPGFPLHHVQSGSLARLFLLAPLQLSNLVEKARKAGLMRRARTHGRTLLALVHSDQQQAVEALL